jgi:hypothetical protein
MITPICCGFNQGYIASAALAAVQCSFANDNAVDYGNANTTYEKAIQKNLKFENLLHL